jgi:hypothetical protein
LDQFTFTRQTIAFLLVLAVLEVAIVLVSPLIALVLAFVAAPFMIVVWVEAGVRTRKWLWWNPRSVPLTRVQGTIALSAALLFGIGILVTGVEAIRYASGERDLLMGYAFRHIQRETSPVRSVGWRGSHYSSPDMQMALKAELAKAGIAFKVETTDGKEFVLWAPEHDTAIEEIRRKLHEGPSPTGHSVHFDKAETREAFKMWLLKQRIPFEIVEMRGNEYVVWKDGPKELAMQFLKEYYQPCPDQSKAEGGSRKAEVSAC